MSDRVFRTAGRLQVHQEERSHQARASPSKLSGYQLRSGHQKAAGRGPGSAAYHSTPEEEFSETCLEKVAATSRDIKT